MKVFKVLEQAAIDRINKAVEETQWTDGTATAKGAAKKIKKNFQITDNDPIFREKILPTVQAAHSLDPVLSYTHMNKLISPRLASYYDGGHYDWHVDTALMQFHRTDLSFTIFLSDRDSYEGGEMEIQFTGGVNMKVKGAAGEMVVYPSGQLHKVNPVTSGERRVIVGWLKCNVKLHDHRERLYELLATLSKFRETKADADAVGSLNRLYYQLLRDYSE